MVRSIRISLANKCQLLFGAAVILIVSSALAVVWVRMDKLVEEGQEVFATRVAELWLSQQLELVEAVLPYGQTVVEPHFNRSMTLSLIDKTTFAAQTDRFVSKSIAQFEVETDRAYRFEEVRDPEGRPYFRYAQPIRQRQLEDRNFSPSLDISGVANPLQKVLVLQFRSDYVRRQQVLNFVFILGAGLVAMLLAIGAFWFVTMRIILSPVRVLRDTAEKIAEGDTNIRAEINTGDEFEQLSGMFNNMVSNLNKKEQELRQINKSLDLKLGELAEHNVALFEANKIKDEFLANVSHELRTPLHSIIGFAEVLQETLGKAAEGAVDEKRRRYTGNIIVSSKRLLDLINDLLDLAKIEAGRIELNIGPMSVADTAEGLMNLMRPQAEKAGIELRLKLPRDIPLLHTDAGKVQQILFNFLSNAVKFTPTGGTVTLSAAVLPPAGADRPQRLRLSVADTGPGIASELHERIFDKFTQLDATVTRRHGGTGLGLTISRDLAALLQGEIELESEVGKGATFSLLIPFQLEKRSTPLMPNLVGAARPR